MNKPLVSIVTPSYNCGKHIMNTINSVMCQTYQNWEMVIVDDYSTDNSLSIIEAAAKQDDRIKLIPLKRILELQKLEMRH